MNKELKITKEDLVNWIDRPPSNDDLDLCKYLSNAVQNREKYFEKIKQLQNNWNELKKWLEEVIKDIEKLEEPDAFDRYERQTLKNTLSKMQELENSNNE